MASTLEYADKAIKTKDIIKGVKGPCAFSKIMPDFIAGTAIDSRHCIYEGNTKKLMHLWFDAENGAAPFSLRQVIDVIDDKFQKIQVPRFVHRLSDKITSFATWKASEYMNCFFITHFQYYLVS